MGYNPYILFLLILIFMSPKCQSWGWFSSGDTRPSDDERWSADQESFKGLVVEFSMDGLNNQKGVKLVENAVSKIKGTNTCWKKAYLDIYAACSKIMADEEMQSKLAWSLSDCFQHDTGRPSFPHCDTKSPMRKCLQKLNDHDHGTYLGFYLEAKSICYQLQSHAFKAETERLVNALKDSAQATEDKLDAIGGISNTILQNSNQIFNSLTTIEFRTEEVVQTTKNVGENMDVITKHSNAIYEQSKEISSSQLEVLARQRHLDNTVKSGMEMVLESYNNLGQEIGTLMNEAVKIEEEISKVGDAMSDKMETLQTKADDIGNMTGISLDKQKKLLDGQDSALEGLKFLTEFQSEALQESRSNLQKLANYTRTQQQELLRRQEELQRVHDNLINNSKSILAAQEAFESRQEDMFNSLDKLFALQKALLLESRIIKAFFVYFMSIFVIYMFTSTKKTYNVRSILYLGLCATFCIEVGILRFTVYDPEHKAWIINMVRTTFLVLAVAQLVHAIYSYRDLETMSYKLLLTMNEKLNEMQGYKELLMDEDSDVNWASWIDLDLPEDVDMKEDPDFWLPEQVAENSSTNDSSITRKYDLRRRSVL